MTPTNNLGVGGGLGSQVCFWLRTPVAALAFVAPTRQLLPFLLLLQSSRGGALWSWMCISVENEMSLPAVVSRQGGRLAGPTGSGGLWMGFDVAMAFAPQGGGGQGHARWRRA